MQISRVNAVDSPSQISNDDQGLYQGTKIPSKDLGPTFHALQDRQRRGLIAKYAWRHQQSQIVIIISFVVIVFVGTVFWNELHLPNSASETPKSLTDWLINAQSIFSLGTILVALSLWWGEIREDWENDLPKRLSVFFFYEDNPLIVCRYVWLAGADEIRTWGQQVALQAQPSKQVQPDKKVAGKDKLDFGPDVETRKPILLLGPGGEVWKHYSVCFRLTDLNPTLTDFTKQHPGNCIYQNLAAANTKPDDVSQETMATMPEVADWKAVIQQKLSKESD